MPTPLISGMGTVAAPGLNTAEILATLRTGQRAPGRLTLFASPLDLPVFEATRFQAVHPHRDGLRTLDLALHAVAEAFTQARLEPGSFDPRRIGVCLGTTVASQLNDLDFYRQLKTTGTAPMDSVQRYLKGNLAEAVAAQFGIQGLTATLTNACSSGADAIAMGAQWIAAGLCDIVIAGGADELNEIPYAGFHSLGLGSPQPCTPFDKNRRGLNLGEGAGILLLESIFSAASRGHSPHLALYGYASSCDAHHLTAPHPEGIGLSRAITTALADAGLQADQIAFVNAHGTGTKDNDRVEGNVLAKIFGPKMPMLSTKGYTGHTLGAAGGLEAVFTALGLRERWLPSSAGFQEADEEIALHPLREPTAVTGGFALSTSLAFGGNNTALILGIHE